MSYNVDFHREVFKLHKRWFDVNACRIHAFMPPGDIMLGADEAGILLIDQSAVWSVNDGFYASGGDWLLKNLAIEFSEWVKRDRNCPSVVIWDVENEMLRFNYEIHLPWISQLRGMVEKFDNTRPINYSGAGWFSDEQDMVSLHMQDHYTRIMTDWNEKGTKPLIMGEFWIGGRANQHLPHAPEFTSVHQRYLEETKLYERNLLEMRYQGVAGLMPFRISLLTLFQKPHTTEGYHFTPPDKLEIQTQPKDVLQKIRHAMQPVTVFFCRAKPILLLKNLSKERWCFVMMEKVPKILMFRGNGKEKQAKRKGLSYSPASNNASNSKNHLHKIPQN